MVDLGNVVLWERMISNPKDETTIEAGDSLQCQGPMH